MTHHHSAFHLIEITEVSFKWLENFEYSQPYPNLWDRFISNEEEELYLYLAVSFETSSEFVERRRSVFQTTR
jgi:hypothetical protein